MKKLKLSLPAFLLALLISSCGSSNKDSVDQANDQNDQRDTTNAMTTADEGDAKFLVMTADGGMAEAELGKYAMEKSSNQKVKDFASMMVKDHTKANEEAMTLASSKGISMPTSVSDDHRKKINDIESKTGSDFDKEYISHMVDAHKETIDKFEKMTTEAKDVEIRDWAVKTLPTLRMHLEEAMKIKDSVK